MDADNQKLLSNLAYASGLPSRIILSAALSEWQAKHCPDNTVAGRVLADLESTTESHATPEL